MKRRNSKKTGVIALIAGLSSVTLVSIGFASWIISAGDSATLNGSIDVDTVEDHRYNILNKSALESRTYNVVFGHPETMDAENEWLKATGTKVESLEFTFKVYVENMDADKGLVTAALDYAGTDATYTTNKTTYEAQDESHSDHDVVKDLPTPVVGSKTLDNDEESDYKGKYFVTVTVTFGWGSAFNHLNPYTFYNAAGKSAATDGDDAKIKLGYVATLASVGYKLTITTSEVSA